MAKKSVKIEVNNFVKGLITEASPLNFPPNASIAEQNFELSKTGSRRRRKGLDFEEAAVKYAVSLLPSALDTANISTFIWKNAGGTKNKNYVVVQVNNELRFFNLSNQNLSGDGYEYGLILPSGYGVDAKFSFASIDGNLVVVFGGSEFFVIKDDWTYDIVSLKTRDLWGVQDTPCDEDPLYRTPIPASYNTIYNLYNQSWGVPRRQEGAVDKQAIDPAYYYSSYYGVFPSYSESVWTAMNMKAAADPFEYMRPNLWGETLGASPKTARGYFIIDVLRRGDSRQTAMFKNKQRFSEMVVGDFTTNKDLTPGGATIVAEFAGRVFYAGFSGEVIDGDDKSPSLSNYVFFSQLVRDRSSITKCYQEGDPTSREGNDIVDTDGGFIRISGIQDIQALVPMGSSLAVIGSNGVWMISGGSDYGFTATNYKVDNITDFGAINSRCVLKAGDASLYWGDDGIFQISKNQIGAFVSTNITIDSIQSYYDGISAESKKKAFGVYDTVSKTLRWVYSESTGFGSEETHYELVLDTRIPAFYVHKVVNHESVKIRGMFSVTQTQEVESDNFVYSEGSLVTVSTTPVTVPYSVSAESPSSFRYLSFVNNSGVLKFSFAYYLNNNFRDWYSIDSVGKDAKAYLITGQITAGDSSISKQAPYLTLHFERTETGVEDDFTLSTPSGCLFRSQWEWSNSVNSKKWSPLYQGYRYPRGYLPSNTTDDMDTGFELITTRNKLRGIGRAVSLYFETEPYKDCKIIGWSLALNGNTVT